MGLRIAQAHTHFKEVYLRAFSQVTKYYAFGGQRIAMRRDHVLFFLAGDHLGTVSVVLDAAGNAVDESRHYPYGTERWSMDGTFPTDYRFTGQRLESSLGLYHMGARWYDPFLARWLSADTIVPNPTSPQSLNRYSWVLGNPLMFSDPTGQKETACDDSTAGCEDDELYHSYQWYCSENSGSQWCQPTMTPAEAGFWFVAAVGGAEALAGLLEVGGSILLEALGTEAVTRAAINGGMNAAGYVVGSVATDEEVDPVDAGLAFVAGAVTPGGSGSGLTRLGTGVLWGMVSNGAQSAASQWLDMKAGERSDFSTKELAIDLVVGGIGTGVGDFFAKPAESYAQNLLRGFARGASGAVQIASDTIFSWVRSWLE